MISTDQPTTFKGKIVVAVSSIEDGDMKLRGHNSRKVHKNRQQFLEENNIRPSQTVLVRMSYEADDFTKYSTVKKVSINGENEIGDYISSDALVTDQKEIALFLPLADCVGAVLYDPKKKALMVSHLGRHNVEQYGAKHSVEYMVEEFGSSPKDILVWMSPAAGKENYPLFKFNDKSLHEVNEEHFLSAGILPSNIQISLVDTTKDENYYSHSEFLKGHQQNESGRFAIVAMMPA